MKKKIFIIGLSALALCGCGKIPKLSNGEDAVVTFKDDKKISVNDFYNKIKDTYGLNTLISMIDTYIYEKEFSDKINDAKTYSEASLKQLINYYGSESEALKMLQYSYNYQSLDAYKNATYINYLQSEAIEAYVKGKITEEELKKYYEESVYPDMTISHILITPDVTEDMDDKAKEKAEKEAKDKINKIISSLNEAKKKKEDIAKKFETLAKENSEDDSTKNKGGNLGEINIGSLDSKYDELVKKAASLEDGEYSTEIITTELGYHVILKTKTGKKKSYKDSLDSMKDAITNKKLSGDESNSLMVEAIKSYRKKYDMDIVDSEIDRQYGRYMNSLINNK